MENATRALTMAGGILIALMILGALFLMFNNLSSYQNQNDTSTKSTQIAEFNNQFEPYNKKDNLTLMELHSVYNKVNSNNTKNPEYKIEMIYEFNSNHEDGNLKENFKSNFTAIEEAEKMNSTFSCINIENKGVDGRISKIVFKDTTQEVKSWVRVKRN
jgi:cell division protein FtsL